MKNTDKRKRTFLTALQLGLLGGIIFIGGLVIPIYTAPYLANFLSITTPYEVAQQTMSVQISNRNANNGETVVIGISNPDSSVQMESFLYSCGFSEISLIYMNGNEMKNIPCDVELQLPPRTQHRLRVQTSKNEITYMPITIMLRDGESFGEISAIIAISGNEADKKSSLSDGSTATIQTFFRE
jgi:hypothetical protein